MKSLLVIFITGPTGSGKSTLIRELLDFPSMNKFHAEGIISIGLINTDGRKDFTLYDISGKEEILLASKIHFPDFIKLGNYYFNPSAIQSGETIILNSINNNPQVIIVDEIGPLELADKIWSYSLFSVMKKYTGVLILTVRDNIIQEVRNRFNIPSPVVFNIKMNPNLQIIRDIINLLNRKYNEIT